MNPWGHVPAIGISAHSLQTAKTIQVDTAATADLVSMAMEYSVWQKVIVDKKFLLL